jgi:bifunctional ADP-heptose synthase (sugar kinase/adenylyltransferase)
MGDELAVGVTKDAYVGKNGRPIIPENERLELVRSIRDVNDARLVRDSIEALEMWEPEVFVKGHDYRRKGLLDSEIEYCKEHNIVIMFTKENPQTTTKIIERIKNG